MQDHLDHKGTSESTLGKDSSVPLMHCEPSDIGSMICFGVFPKKTYPKASYENMFILFVIDFSYFFLPYYTQNKIHYSLKTQIYKIKTKWGGN